MLFDNFIKCDGAAQELYIDEIVVGTSRSIQEYFESTCSDGVQNADETAVDCGGPCDPCADGAVAPPTNLEVIIVPISPQ